MKTVLITGVTPGFGTTIVLNGLQTYWRRYHSNQTVNQMMIPALTLHGVEKGLEPDLGQLWRSLCQIQQDTDLLCLEGEGSLARPITKDTTLATLAKEWQFPILLVVDVNWEAIAPTVATIALAREAKTTIVGLILNQHQPNPDISPEAMAEILQSLTHRSILGTIPFLEEPNDETVLSNLASELMLDVVIDKLGGSSVV